MALKVPVQGTVVARTVRSAGSFSDKQTGEKVEYGEQISLMVSAGFDSSPVEVRIPDHLRKEAESLQPGQPIRLDCLVYGERLRVVAESLAPAK